MSPPQDTQPREAGKTTGLLKYYVLWFFIAWIGLWWICRERHESIIVYGGPFERHFREDLYYPRRRSRRGSRLTSRPEARRQMPIGF